MNRPLFLAIELVFEEQTIMTEWDVLVSETIYLSISYLHLVNYWTEIEARREEKYEGTDPYRRLLLTSSMNIEFTSKYFRNYILTVISLVLLWDAVTLYQLHIGLTQYRFKIISFESFALIFGFTVRIAILVTTLMLKGPLKQLLYIWGGMILAGGFFHFMSVLINGENPASMYSLFKLIMIIFGFSIVIPAVYRVNNHSDA